MNRTINEMIMLTDTSEVLLAVSAYKRMPTQTREMVQVFAGDTDDHGDYDEHGQSVDGDGKYTMRMLMPSMTMRQLNNGDGKLMTSCDLFSRTIIYHR